MNPFKKIFQVLILNLSLFSCLYSQDPFTRLNPFGDDIGKSKGVGWADFNNDGNLDIYITNGAEGVKEKNFLYQNNGDGTFTKITTGDIVNDLRISGGCSWGDFDNDGDLDLYVVTNSDSPVDPNLENFLYTNNGDGTFTKNLTAGPPVTDKEYSAVCGWGDYNNDSHLDLFVRNGWWAKRTNSLYRSNGDGTFAKITDIPLVSADNASFIGGMSWADYDNDGDLDLFVAGGSGPNNFLWRNDGGENFVKIDIFDEGDSQACSWGDYDNDGDLDLYVTNYGESEDAPEKNFLYRNDGNDTFTKITTAGDIVSDQAFSTGSCWGDIDNDGDLDMYVGSVGYPDQYKSFLYINNGDGTFSKNTSSVVTDCTWVYGSTFTDYNKDGFVDLLTARNGRNFLYQNNGIANGNTNHWIDIRCVGTMSNKAGIGAIVRVKATINAQVVWQMRDISAQTGYGSHNSLSAHFGVGDATMINELKVEWPSGIVQTLTNIAVNQFLTITEEEGGESIQITKPNGGESWQAGSVQQITWFSSGTSGSVRIEYSSNGGTSWSIIESSTEDDGSYLWTVPDVSSENCLVRITDVDGNPSDESDDVFKIFNEINYTLTMSVNPPESGTTDPPVGDHIYAENIVVNITATPATGYRFVNWTGDVANPNSASTTVTMNADKAVTANFELIPTYTLTMAANPTNGGTTDPPVGNHTYDEGTIVSITATPNAGYEFVNWTGDVANPNSPSTTVTMNSDKTVTANFQQITHTLTMTVNPAGSGTTNPPVGDHIYAENTVVNITATPATGYRFVNWTGDVANPNSASTTVTMNADKAVTANFELIPTYTLTMAANPTNGGTTDPPVGDHNYQEGIVVTITATPSEGFSFINWTGEVADPNSATTTVTMNGDKTVTANFTQAGVSVSGTVYYAIPKTKGVTGTTMTLSGGATATQATDGNGFYQFIDLTSGLDYLITPAKTDDYDSGDIMMYDASLTAQHAVGLITLSVDQQWAADVDKNGIILMYDASQIAQCSVGLPTPPESHVGEWEFNPLERNYESLNADQMDQNFNAVLLGDVDGNWTTQTLLKEANNSFQDLGSQLLDYETSSGEIISVPFMARGGQQIYSTDIEIIYDPTVIKFVLATKTELSEGFHLIFNNERGRLRLGIFGVKPINQAGEFLRILFEVIGNKGTSCDIRVERFQINNGQIYATKASVAVNDIQLSMPQNYSLEQNYPNPFNPETIISYSLANSQPQQTSLIIYNFRGEIIRTLVNEEKSSGTYKVIWDGTDDHGVSVSSGVYLSILKSGTFKSVKKMIKIK